MNKNCECLYRFFFCFLLGISNGLFSQSIEEISEQNVFCEWQGKNASASICEGFIGKASYLYWQAKEDGLEFAQVLDLTLDFPNPIIADVKQLEPNSKWQSGFEVGIGYIFPQRSQWDLLLNWTWFHSNAKNSHAVNELDIATQQLRPNWLPFLTGPAAFDAFGSWALKYNTLDLLLGRAFFLGKWLSFHPQAGIRGAWIKQDYDAQYHGLLGNVPTGKTFFDATWTYNALGIRLGTDGQWHFNSYFSFVANGFLSILYGKYQLQEEFFGTFSVGGGTLASELLQTKKDYYRVRAALESELGIRVQKFFSEGRRRILLGGYYGFSYWIRQNEMINEFFSLDSSGNNYITTLPTTGDLQLQGLRIELEVDF